MRHGRSAVFSVLTVMALALIAATGQAVAQPDNHDDGVLGNQTVGDTDRCTAAGCTWERTLGGAAEDKAYAVVALPDDGLMIAGNTLSFGTARYDAWIARLNRAGETMWSRRIGGPQADHVYALAAGDRGGVLAAGDTRSTGAGESDVWLLRLDDSGEILWQRTLGGAGNDRARSALALPGGGFVVAGFAGIDAGDRDIWLARLTDDGIPLWQRRFGGPGNDGAFHVALGPDGALLATGYWQTGVGQGFDLWVARLDAAGEMAWQRRFDRGSFDAGTGVVPQADGGLAVIGMTQIGGPADVDVWVLRLDRTGDLTWERQFGGPGTDGAWAAIGRPDGTLVISAATASQGAGSTDAWMIGLDADGGLAWEQVIGGALWDRPTALAAADNGELLLAGYTTTVGAGFEDIWLLRLDREGRR